MTLLLKILTYYTNYTVTILNYKQVRYCLPCWFVATCKPKKSSLQRLCCHVNVQDG